MDPGADGRSEGRQLLAVEGLEVVDVVLGDRQPVRPGVLHQPLEDRIDDVVDVEGLLGHQVQLDTEADHLHLFHRGDPAQ